MICNSILQRIPAASVERIEVIRGSAPGIDMQGQSVVANVVRKKDASGPDHSVSVHLTYHRGRAMGAVGRHRVSRPERRLAL